MPRYVTWLAIHLAVTAVAAFALDATAKDEEIEIAVHGPDNNWPLRTRKLSDEDLTERRTEKEDDLRKAVLEVILTRQEIVEIRTVLNSPWSKQSIDNLVQKSLDAKDVHMTERIFNLLAYLSVGNAGKETADWAVDGFDVILKEIDHRLETRPYDSYTWCFAMNAIENYGCSRLFTQVFWILYRKGPQCASRALHRHGDQSALRKLQDIGREKTFNVGSKAMECLERDILVLTAELIEPKIREERSLYKRVDAAKGLRDRDPKPFRWRE